MRSSATMETRLGSPTFGMVASKANSLSDAGASMPSMGMGKRLSATGKSLQVCSTSGSLFRLLGMLLEIQFDDLPCVPTGRIRQ
jgi:hypothetical protein